VFALAATGLLDGLEVTTHWQYADELARRYPRVRVRPEALYLEQGGIVTGAGAAAGLDMCLHLIRRDHGAALANEIARILVTPPHRDGGQQQFIPAPLADGLGEDRLAEVISWARPQAIADVERWSGLVTGRGACHHPDGTTRFVRSALRTFAAEVGRHQQGRCSATAKRPFLPIPTDAARTEQDWI